jgi:rRNA-processing protein FCF1
LLLGCRSLDYMKRIIGSKKFTVVIPLVVVAELKGLKRGQMRHRPVDAPEEDYDPRQREAVQRGTQAV